MPPETACRTRAVWPRILLLVSLTLCGGCDWLLKLLEGRAIDTASVAGSTSTAGGTVVAFLRDRKDGHSGEDYWREAVPPYPRMDGIVPISPTDWNFVLVESGPDDLWVLLRYRVKSTTAAGVPIEKLWDFCTINTVKGFRLVATWEADDSRVKACADSLKWPKYDYPPKGWVPGTR